MGLIEFIKAIYSMMFNFYENTGLLVYTFYLENSRLILDYVHLFFNNTFYFLLFLSIILTFLYATIGVYVFFNKKKIKKDKSVSDSELPFLTVQIPTYNELAAINCARRCVDSDYPTEKYQIIIGDDSSDKEVSKKIDEFAAQHKDLVLVTRRGSNKGFKPGNLNHMLEFTNGDYIVILDSDFLPEEDFLRRIVSPFIQDKTISAVQAKWVIKNFSQNLVSIVGGVIPMFSHQLALPFLDLMGGTSFIAGSAEAIKKKDLLELGGWREGSLTEDIEYSLRLTKNGKKIKYLSNLGCECESPFKLKDLCKQQMRWAYGVITAIKLHFIGILSNKKLQFKNVVNSLLLLSGYVVTALFFLLAVFGFVSIITHRPEVINWEKFISEISLNITLTSGFLLASMLTLVLAKKTRHIPKMVVASFSVGLIVIYHITKGIFKAIFNREMKWFMLTKHGNLIK